MPLSGGVATLIYDWSARRDAGSPSNIIGADEMMQQQQDIADMIETALMRDGQNTATSDIGLGGFKFTNVGAASARTHFARVAELQDSSHTWIAGSGSDIITATYTPAVTSLTNGMLLGFRAAAANASTTPTFAPNGLTAKTIVKGANSALVAGDIAGQHHECFVRYNSSLDKWVLLNPADAQNATISAIQASSYTWADGGGTADAITTTYTPALGSLVDGALVGVRAAAVNATTTPTFSPNGLTAKTIVKGANAALVAGDIAGDGHELLLRYASDIDKWVLLNPIYPGGTTIDLNSLTTDSTLGDIADYLSGVDVSESNASNKALVADILYNALNSATANAAPSMSADHVLMRDNGASAIRKVLGRYIGAGKQTIWIPAGAMVARTTNGAASGTVETATNKVMIKTLDFDASTAEYAQVVVQMPKGWNEGTLTAVFVWSHASTTTNFAVVWGIQALAVGDDDALDSAFGTAVEVTDTGGTTNDIYRSSETSAMTPAGSAAENDVVVFQAYRKAADGADTLAVDARLHGVALFFTTNANTDD